MSVCRHCGAADEADGMHTCTCPYSDDSCPDHPAPELVVCPDEKNCEPYGDHYRRAQEGRCIRCGNWPKICGHDLPFKERIKGVRANYIGWSDTR